MVGDFLNFWTELNLRLVLGVEETFHLSGKGRIEAGSSSEDGEPKLRGENGAVGWYFER